MGLFIAIGASFLSNQATTDLIVIAAMDTGYGETGISATRTQVTYVRTLTGVPQTRLDDLVNNLTYTSPPDIVIFAVDGSFLLADGSPITSFGGIATPVGHALNPTASDVALIYDTSDCNGNVYWVDKNGGGTTDIPTAVMLYHELSHCFHFVTGTTASTSAQEEVNAEIDENIMRTQVGSPLRDTASHNGGCGLGISDPSPIPCCIIASISTGSPYSGEVTHLRTVRDRILRRSAVGDDFFNTFFYAYYGFSPEVCSVMGNNPALTGIVKTFFVTPIIYTLELIVHYSDHKGKYLAAFLRKQFEDDEFRRQYDIKLLSEMDVCLALLNTSSRNTVIKKLPGWIRDINGIETLFNHLNSDAASDSLIKWSLLDTLHIWVRGAIKMYSGKTDKEIEELLYAEISNWISLFPLTGIWNEFSRIETEMELQNLNSYIFDSNGKTNFAKRLIHKYPTHKGTILKWSLN